MTLSGYVTREQVNLTEIYQQMHNAFSAVDRCKLGSIPCFIPLLDLWFLLQRLHQQHAKQWKKVYSIHLQVKL